jgi:putative endonuclease
MTYYTQEIMKIFYVYIMGSDSGTLYVGLTNDIKRRVYEHKQEIFEGFSKKYKTNKLLYFESIGDSLSAIAREKQIKRWRREKKVKLIDTQNPDWKDLASD